MAKKAVKQAQKLETLPPPIGGINARDAISLMPETDAVSLVNWIPDTYGLRCRRGYREWATGIPDGEPVNSLMSYIAADTPIPGELFTSNPTSMPGKLFAATPEAIYDVTDSGDTPAALVALSGTDRAGMFSSAMVSNIVGNILCAVSEDDGYYTFNGTAWTKIAAGVGAGQMSGVDPDDVAFVMLWKRRLWFVERTSTRAWYLPTDSITGVAVEFDFGAEFRKGGFLAYLANWTIDAGEGVDDFLVAVSSNGEVVLYKGTDPSSASTFGKVGTFFVGQIPIGRRGAIQYGGDLVLISANGVYPMSFITRGGSGLLQATGQEYSSKIRSPLGEDLQNSFNIDGWAMALHPSERILLVSVPDYGGRRNRQYVMSTNQNQWTTFEDIPIFCFGESLSYMFAGTLDGRVLLLFKDFFDDVPLGSSAGLGIRTVVQPAFSFFKTPALEKQFLMVRPTFLSVDRPAYRVTMNINFESSQASPAPTPAQPEGAVWDVSEWDSAMWAGAPRSFKNWNTVGGVGFAGAINMTCTCTGSTVLAAVDYMFQSGGP